jgi:hypothetical protein
MAIDLELFDALSLNQDLEVDAADLSMYELANEGVYSIDDANHDLILANLDNSLYNSSQLDYLRADLEQNTVLNQFEADHRIIHNDGGTDYIDEVVQAEAPNDVEKIDTINSHLEGTIDPKSGVLYESNTVQLPDGSFVEGVFPVFDSDYDAVIPPEHYESGSYTHAQIANEQLAAAVEQNPSYEAQFNEMQLEQIRDGETPDGYTWHHHEEAGRMQLVDSETHELARHTGGMSLWGGGY